MRLLLVAALVAASVPLAAAQVPQVCQAATVSIAPGFVDLVQGASANFTVILTNPNRVAADAALEFEVPAGFSVEPRSAGVANVPAAQSAEVQVVATALESAAPGSTGQLVAVVTLSCGAAPLAQPSGEAVASADLRVVAPADTPLTGILAYAREPAVVAAGGLALVILVGAVAIRRTREGFVASCPEPRKTVRPGRGTSFPLEVSNRASSTDTAVLSVGEVPEGWTAFTAVPELQLGAREGRTVWLMVRAPPSAAVGTTVEIPVRAQSRAHPSRAADLTLVAEVSETGPESEAG